MRRVIAALAGCALLALGGCATVPSSGTVQQDGGAQAGVGQQQDYAQPIPVGPGAGWSPAQIVNGFLAASASFAGNHAVARQYLDTAARRKWRPGWAVTVVSTTKASIVALPRQFALQPSSGLARVQVTGQPVATLTGGGQYLASSGPPTESFSFSLIKIGGQWRIDSLPPSTPLLLTEADFQRVYQSRDLYFLAPGGRALVPDPVFVPQEATDAQLATGLVNALLQGPAGWLFGAAATSFPAGTRQLAQVKIIGPDAIVDLGGGAAKAGRPRRGQMAAQLAWTLASGPSPIHAVELEIDGRPQQLRGSQYQLPQTYHTWVATQPAGSALYVITSDHTVEALPDAGQPGSGQAARPVAGPAGAPGAPALGSVAVSPDGRSIAGISPDGSTVYIAGLSRGAAFRTWPVPGGGATSVSWDAQGGLWVAAAKGVWLVSQSGAGGLQEVPVAMTTADQVTDFRVAPDGVRAVMIVNGQVQLAAITRVGQAVSVGPALTIGGSIADPDELSWYGPDDVIVLSGSGAGTQLDEVPLDGSQPAPIATDGGTVSMTAISTQASGSYIAVGLAGGQIMLSVNQGAFQPLRVSGGGPAYPG